MQYEEYLIDGRIDIIMFTSRDSYRHAMCAYNRSTGVLLKTYARLEVTV